MCVPGVKLSGTDLHMYEYACWGESKIEIDSEREKAIERRREHTEKTTIYRKQ